MWLLETDGTFLKADPKKLSKLKERGKLSILTETPENTNEGTPKRKSIHPKNFHFKKQ